jgi:hypothetical protein
MGIRRDSRTLTHRNVPRRPEQPLPLRIDHVLFAVDDLDIAHREVERRFGLRSIEGGRHPAWGTANRIVPLGDTYIELVAVADPDIAATTVFGRWVAAGHPGRPLGWAVRTDELDAVVERLGMPIAAGSRQTPAGDVLRWRSAGVPEAAAEPALPFFIEWAAGSAFPGAAAVDHPGGGATLKRLSFTGDADRITAWLGDDDLPIDIEPGVARPARLVLARPGGDIQFDW